MLRSVTVLAAVALIAIAAWPFAGIQRASATASYFSPVQPDYRHRDQTIAFYEQRLHDDPQDQISARILGAQYLQRYRETQDVGDIIRGIRQATGSLRIERVNNAAADEVAASGYYALHNFRTALTYELAAHSEQPNDSNAPAQIGLLHMELGQYGLAVHDLSVARRIQDGPAVWAAAARYYEVTGNLARAQQLMELAAQRTDAIVDNPAQVRAWYHFRLGEMLFAGGDVGRAEAQERFALSEFPNFELAYRALARFCWGAKDWNCTLDAAKKGAEILPEPEVLGYEADAQQAMGDGEAAKQTQALIVALERLGNAFRINDRLLSVYYSEHGIRLDDSQKIALREAAARGNEIYAQDTLAWSAATDGHWALADRAMHAAIRFDTQDPRIQYHAGMIDYHFGRFENARRHLQRALALNAQFDPFYADEARHVLMRLH